MTRKSRGTRECPSRVVWMLAGGASTLGGLWLLAALWRRAWGLSPGGHSAPITPTPTAEETP